MAFTRHLIIAFLMGLLQLSTAVAADSVRVSLLTCSPGKEVYELYGHTAIRYADSREGMDVAFNYGLFSFRTPNFVMRFVKGETDYQLGIVPFGLFLEEYLSRGSSVTEQVLNLTEDEKSRLLELLKDNYRVENRTYRYNFFYDNCTTRARDKIEQALSGKVVYPRLQGGDSFRDIIHEFNDVNLWSRLGIDFCLGAEADVPVTDRQKMFAPFYMLRAADKALVERGGERVPLVSDTHTYEPTLSVERAEIVSPLVVFFVIGFIFMVLFAFCKNKTVVLVSENILFLLQAAAGSIVAFLVFFSQHPTVNSNWLIWVFSPLPVVYTFFSILRRDWLVYYHYANLSVIAAFLLLIWLIPQQIGMETLFLATYLLSISVVHLVRNRKR